jgi:hypothetical protein
LNLSYSCPLVFGVSVNCNSYVFSLKGRIWNNVTFHGISFSAAGGKKCVIELNTILGSRDNKVVCSDISPIPGDVYATNGITRNGITGFKFVLDKRSHTIVCPPGVDVFIKSFIRCCVVAFQIIPTCPNLVYLRRGAVRRQSRAWRG